MPQQPRPLLSSARRRRQWSAELCKADHRELQATAMGLNCKGSLALLAGKRLSALVQLHWDRHNTLGEPPLLPTDLGGLEIRPSLT